MPRKQAVVDLLSHSSHVTFDGANYDLIFSNSALIEFERLTGLNTLTEMQSILESPTLDTLSTLLYVLLKRAGAKYTREDCADLITPKNTSEIYQSVLKAWVNSIKPAEADEDPNPAQA